jgi:hypothetical protein
VTVGQQAGAKLAVCRQAQAVAVAAEMLAQGTDESDFSLWARQDDKRLAGPSLESVFHGNQSPDGGNFFLDFRCQIWSRERVRLLPMGMYSIKRMWKGWSIDKSAEIENFVVVDAPHGHDIDFDGGKADFMGPLDPGPHLLESVVAGNLGKFFRDQRIQADVDAANAGIVNMRCALDASRTPLVVRETSSSSRCGSTGAAIDGPFSDQGLAAGDADFANAEPNADADQPQNFFVAEDIAWRSLGCGPLVRSRGISGCSGR